MTAATVAQVAALTEQLKVDRSATEKLESDLSHARIRLANTQTLYDAACVRLREEEAAAPCDVDAVIRDLDYSKLLSQPIRVTGGGIDSFVCEPRKYDLGMGDLSMRAFREAKVYDFSNDVSRIFAAAGRNILEQTQRALADKWEEIVKAHLFLLPVNTDPGRIKRDLPNVSWAVTLLALKRVDIEFVIVDPVYKGTDKTVRVVNLSRVVRDLQTQRVRVRTAFGLGGLRMIMYQRGAGKPTGKVYDQLRVATGLGPEHVMHCHLTPGKYEKGLCGGDHRNDFADSVAKILHELAILDPFTTRKNVRTIEKVYFVLDEFSGYSMYVAAAIIGYGLESVASVLAFRQGVYTEMNVASSLGGDSATPIMAQGAPSSN